MSVHKWRRRRNSPIIQSLSLHLALHSLSLILSFIYAFSHSSSILYHSFIPLSIIHHPSINSQFLYIPSFLHSPSHQNSATLLKNESLFTPCGDGHFPISGPGNKDQPLYELLYQCCVSVLFQCSLHRRCCQVSHCFSTTAGTHCNPLL